jgi:hypothetical protein
MTSRPGRRSRLVEKVKAVEQALTVAQVARSMQKHCAMWM